MGLIPGPGNFHMPWAWPKKIFIQDEKRNRLWEKIRNSNLDMSSAEFSNEVRSLDIQDCSFKIKDFKTTC